jgi:hypothetical protein
MNLWIRQVTVSSLILGLWPSEANSAGDRIQIRSDSITGLYSILQEDRI